MTDKCVTVHLPPAQPPPLQAAGVGHLPPAPRLPLLLLPRALVVDLRRGAAPQVGGAGQLLALTGLGTAAGPVGRGG